LADHVPEYGKHDVPLVNDTGLIPTADEIAERQRAEQEHREQDNRQLLLDLQTRQTAAQALQASSNVTIARLTGALVIVSLIGGFVSFLQFQATNQSAKAAQSAAGAAVSAAITASAALEENKRQFQSTLTQMQQQTRATWIAAGIAQKQFGLSQSQVNTRVEFSNFNIMHDEGPARSTTVMFDIVNNGALEATAVKQASGTIYGKAEPVPEEAALNIYSSPFSPDQKGEILDKQHPQHFEISVGDAIFWYHWERFSYFDGFGNPMEICQVIRSSGKKNYFFRHEPCPIPSASKTKK